jgi:hypothetical protein
VAQAHAALVNEDPSSRLVVITGLPTVSEGASGAAGASRLASAVLEDVLGMFVDHAFVVRGGGDGVTIAGSAGIAVVELLDASVLPSAISKLNAVSRTVTVDGSAVVYSPHVHSWKSLVDACNAASAAPSPTAAGTSSATGAGAGGAPLPRVTAEYARIIEAVRASRVFGTPASSSAGAGDAAGLSDAGNEAIVRLVSVAVSADGSGLVTADGE